MRLFDFLFKSGPAKPTKVQRPSATPSKAPAVKPTAQQPVSKPGTKKKVSIKVSNHDEIDKSIQLESESDSTILELYCTVRPARIFCHSVLIDKLGDLTKFIISSLYAGHSIEEISELTHMESTTIKEETEYLIRGGLVNDDRESLTELGLQYGRLKNGNGTENRAPVLFDTNLTFINYDGDSSYHENKNAYKQISNDAEVKAVVCLVMKVREADKNCKIAIVTPYKGQKCLISNTLIREGIHYQLDNIYVDTIDSFQGSEADVVLFCTTRAVTPTLFFKDTRRLNVALSRARRELIVIGRLGYFYKYKRKESCLPELVDYIKKNGNVVPASQCAFLGEIKTKTKSKDLLLVIEDISIPSIYYLEKADDFEIQSKIDECYNNGDFLQPILVERTSSGYLLKDHFTQFKAAQELNLSECLCRVI